MAGRSRELTQPLLPLKSTGFATTRHLRNRRHAGAFLRFRRVRSASNLPQIVARRRDAHRLRTYEHRASNLASEKRVLWGNSMSKQKLRGRVLLPLLALLAIRCSTFYPEPGTVHDEAMQAGRTEAS